MAEELMKENNALGWLRAEHERIERLIATVLEIDQVDFDQQVITQLVQELQVHSAIEQEYFYPFAAKVVPDYLMERPRPYDQQMSMYANQLDDIDVGSTDFKRMVSSLLEAFNRHCYEQEQYLFLNLEGRDPDFYNQSIRLAEEMSLAREEMLVRLRRKDATAETPAVQQRLAQEKGRGIYPPRDVMLPGDQPAADSGEDIRETSEGEKVSMGASSVDLKDPGMDERDLGDEQFRREGMQQVDDDEFRAGNPDTDYIYEEQEIIIIPQDTGEGHGLGGNA